MPFNEKLRIRLIDLRQEFDRGLLSLSVYEEMCRSSIAEFGSCVYDEPEPPKGTINLPNADNFDCTHSHNYIDNNFTTMKRQRTLNSKPQSPELNLEIATPVCDDRRCFNRGQSCRRNYTKEDKLLAVALYDSGMSAEILSQRTDVSKSTIEKWISEQVRDRIIKRSVVMLKSKDFSIANISYCGGISTNIDSLIKLVEKRSTSTTHTATRVTLNKKKSSSLTTAAGFYTNIDTSKLFVELMKDSPSLPPPPPILDDITSNNTTSPSQSQTSVQTTENEEKSTSPSTQPNTALQQQPCLIPYHDLTKHLNNKSHLYDLTTMQICNLPQVVTINNPVMGDVTYNASASHEAVQTKAQWGASVERARLFIQRVEESGGDLNRFDESIGYHPALFGVAQQTHSVVSRPTDADMEPLQSVELPVKDCKPLTVKQPIFCSRTDALCSPVSSNVVISQTADADLIRSITAQSLRENQMPEMCTTLRSDLPISHRIVSNITMSFDSSMLSNPFEDVCVQTTTHALRPVINNTALFSSHHAVETSMLSALCAASEAEWNARIAQEEEDREVMGFLGEKQMF